MGLAGALAPLAVGLGLTALVYMGGHVSGAQYNPAVSIALWLRGEQPLARTFALVMLQLIAATAGAATVHLGAPESWNFVVTPADWSPGKKGIAVIGEFLLTFMLLLVILNVAKHPSTSGNGFYGVAIGLTVAAGAILVGPISGGAFNPAVTLGPLVVQSIKGLPAANPPVVAGQTVSLWGPAVAMVLTQLVAAAAAATFSRGQMPRIKR